MGERRGKLFDPAAFARRLNRCMDAQGIDGLTLSQRIGVEASTISRVRNLHHAPNVENYLRLVGWMDSVPTPTLWRDRNEAMPEAGEPFLVAWWFAGACDDCVLVEIDKPGNWLYANDGELFEGDWTHWLPLSALGTPALPTPDP